jgi:probable F420-dependent oxidoreductase
MAATHPFRFGAIASQVRSRQEVRETARRLEDFRFSTMLMTDHLGEDRLTAIPALVTAADATSVLRVGTIVLNNDLRHPAVLAGELATADVVTDGRLEVGMGAGWEKEDYDRSGIPLDSAIVRIKRLEESLKILTAYFTQDRVNFSGEYYTITDMPALPRAVQQPRPPILVGGGGKRILAVAGRCADTIGVHVPATADGTGQDWSAATPEDVEQRISWIKTAAGDRMSSIELCQNIFAVTITNDRESAARQVAERFGMSEDAALASPYFLLGSEDQIVQQLRDNRRRFGISYLIVPVRFVDPMKSIVEELAGT